MNSHQSWIRSEFEFKSPNGLHFLSSFVPVLDDVGTIVSLMGITQDITARVEAETALRQSEAQLQLALSAGGMGVWDFDIASGHISLADSVYPLYGLKRGDLLRQVRLFLLSRCQG